MAWNPSPEVGALRNFAARFGDDYLVLVRINSATGKIGYISYGANKAKCARAKELAEAAHDAIYAKIEREGL